MSTPKPGGITRRSFMKDVAGVALVATAGNAAHGDSITSQLAQTVLGAQVTEPDQFFHSRGES